METVTWCVERQPDGSFLMWIPGTEPRISARNLLELETQGRPNHIVDEFYEDVCRQLSKGDVALVKVPVPGKFFQVS